MELRLNIDREEIFKEYYDKVLRLCKGKISNPTEAEDLASNIFMKIYEKLDSFDSSKASLSTWIYTISNNSIIDYYRSFKIHVEVPEDMSDDSEIDEELLNEETLSELAAALKKLPERERALIVLKYYENKTLKDIADMLGMSYPNAKIIHKKALNSLKKLLTY